MFHDDETGISGPTSSETPVVIFKQNSSSVGNLVTQFASFTGTFSEIRTSENFHSLTPLPPNLWLVYDTISSRETLYTAYHLLPKGGTIISVNRESVNIGVVIGNGKTIFQAYNYAVAPPPAHEPRIKEVYAMIPSFLTSGRIAPGDVEVLPNGLNGISVGLNRLVNNPGSAVTLVLHPGATV